MKHRYLFLLYTVTIAPFYSEISAWVLMSAVAIAAHAFFALHGRLHILNSKIVGGISLFFLSLMYFQFGTILGPEPATSLLIILGALKLEEIRSQRDAMICLYMILLLTMYYLLFSQTLPATIYMIAIVIAVAYSFNLIHASSLNIKRGPSVSSLAIKDVLISLPIFFVLFIVFPRFTTPWASYLSSEKNPIGFSGELRPGELAQLAKSHEIAFRATFADGIYPKQNKLYWRGEVLERTTGWSWSNPERNMRRQIVGVQSPPIDEAAQGTLMYVVTLEPKFDRTLFTLDSPLALEWVSEQPFAPSLNEENKIYTARYPLEMRVQYKGQSKLVKSSLQVSDRLEAFKKIPPASSQVKELVDGWQKNSRSASDFAGHIFEYFNKNKFVYSLSTPAIPDLDTFLFKVRTGFCEHYASAAASLMRHGGYPSRVVMGFQGGEYGFLKEYLIVRDDNAHAWVEFYDNGAWHTFDPTRAVNIYRIELGSLVGSQNEASRRQQASLTKFLSQAALFYDLAEMRYNQFLLNYNFEAQTNLLRLDGKKSWLRWVLFLAALLISGILVLILAKILNRSRGEDDWSGFFEKIKTRLASKGLTVEFSDGPIRLAKKIAERYPSSEHQAEEAFEKYSHLRYGSIPATKTQIQTVRKELYTLIDELT